MPTLKDVAREADVSTATVSRVLNTPDKVLPNTRQRVRRAVKKLGYRPSRVARRLRVEHGQANMIGLVIPDIQNPFFADVTRGVEDGARERDYALILSNSDEAVERQRVALSTLRTEDVDGVILPPVGNDEDAVKELVDDGTPLVCVDRRLEHYDIDTIVSENRRGAYAAVTHLIDHGHTRIAYIGGIPGISTSRERRTGYEDALREHGLEFDSNLSIRGSTEDRGGEKATGRLLDLDHPPTAIFTGNNLTTLGVLATVHRRGLRVPEDVAIVGYDDIPWAMALNPPPTVVDQPGYEMGRRAVELLLQRIEDPTRSTSTITLQPKLIIRKSCGAHSDSNAGASR